MHPGATLNYLRSGKGNMQLFSPSEYGKGMRLWNGQIISGWERLRIGSSKFFGYKDAPEPD